MTSSTVFPEASKALKISSFCLSSIFFLSSYAFKRSSFNSASVVLISCSVFISISSRERFSTFLRLGILFPPMLIFSSFYHYCSKNTSLFMNSSYLPLRCCFWLLAYSIFLLYSSMIALSRSALNSALTAWAMSSRSPFAEFFWGIPTKVFPFHAWIT